MKNDEWASMLAVGVGIYLGYRLWVKKARPWVVEHWNILQEGKRIALPVVGGVDKTDLIGAGVITVLSLVVFTIAMNILRRRRPAPKRGES